jgi:hypothetical protein
MDELTRRVLKLFLEMGRDSLDLHTLFEAGGNVPESREQVLDVVARLVDIGYLESRGGEIVRLSDGRFGGYGWSAQTRMGLERAPA